MTRQPGGDPKTDFKQTVGVAARAAGLDEADALSAVNVAIQLDRLRRHPLAGPRVADATMTVVGLYLDLATARLFHVSADEFVEFTSAEDVAVAEPR